MAKREWGAKHTCADCGVKFYDLHRNPIACPKCGSVIEIETVRPNRRRPPVPPAPPEPAPPEPASHPGGHADAPAEAAGEVEEAPADDEMIDDDLGDDDDGGDDLAADLDDTDDTEPTVPAS